MRKEEIENDKEIVDDKHRRSIDAISNETIDLFWVMVKERAAKSWKNDQGKLKTKVFTLIESQVTLWMERYKEESKGPSHYLDQLTAYFVAKCRTERKYRIINDSDIEKMLVKDPFVGIRDRNYSYDQSRNIEALIDAEIVFLGKRKREEMQDCWLRLDVDCGNKRKKRKVCVDGENDDIIFSDSQNNGI